MYIPPFLSLIHDAEQMAAYALRRRMIAFESVDVGLLVTPSGRIVACDPLTAPEAPPFTRAVPPGKYLVSLGVGRYANKDERIAYALVRFRQGNVTLWDLALVSNQRLTDLGENEVFGYGVDSATGCFMDAESANAYELRLMLDDGVTDFVQDVVVPLLEQNYRDTRCWANVPLDEPSKRNMIAFSSGNGDGTYASYWGLDASGTPLCLVTDFALLD